MTGVADLLGNLSDLVPFLRWRVGPPQPGELVGADLAGDPSSLAAAVTASAPAWDTHDRVVLASLWWQSYAYRVAGTTLACWALNGAGPDPSRPGTAVGVSRRRPSSVTYDPSTELIDDLDLLVERVFAGHLDGVATALRVKHRIGKQLLWGNAAASVASVLDATACASGAPRLHDRIDAITASLPHRISELGTRQDDGQFRRTTCCLWWKTPTAKGGYCSDCPLPGRT